MSDTPATAKPFEPDPRVLLAADRTLLAWVRTGLALMGFGFVVARFGLFLRELAVAGHAVPHDRFHASGWVGTTLIVLGVIVCVVSPVRHAAFVRTYRTGRPIEASLFNAGSVLAVLLGLLGLGLAAYLLVV